MLIGIQFVESFCA